MSVRLLDGLGQWMLGAVGAVSCTMTYARLTDKVRMGPRSACACSALGVRSGVGVRVYDCDCCLL